jgi:hypothetical protein
VKTQLIRESLPDVEHCCDLGVKISQNLQPGAHINAIVSIVAKAHQTANAIHRSFVSRDVNLLV